MKTLLTSALILLALTMSNLEAQTPPVPGVDPGAGPGGVPVVSPAASYSPARMISMQPDAKRSLILKPNERNPYAKRSPGQQDLDETGENADEIEIRNKLSSLSVSGVSRGRNGLRILLGDIIIENGELLPVLIPDQSENLRVIEVTEESITLAWLDIETNEPTGKNLQLTYDLTPSVSYALHGQGKIDPRTVADGEAAKRQMGVLKIGQERKLQRARMAAQDPGRNLPREIYEAAQ